MRENPFVRERLYCPGPTPVPPEVGLASLQTNVYHRTDSFRKTILECRQLLTPFFGSEEAPLILTSSGTGALEAALVNLTHPGDAILVINGGKFGERWEKLGKAYQCEVTTYKIEWGQSPDPSHLTSLLKQNPSVKAVFLQSNETSTGVAYPIQELAAAIRSVSQALIVVDAVSGLVAHSMKMAAWSIDCVVSGSQKGFGIPPGLAFIALSQRAWNELSERPRFYFDLRKEREGQAKGETSWTPATTLILSLLPALHQLAELTPEGCDAHHKRLAQACHAAVQAIGLGLFAQSHPSQALTAVNLPDRLDGSKLIKYCREQYGAIFAGGQDHLKGKIIRISHLGMVDQLDFLAGLAAFEMGLTRLGYRHSLGAGVGAAMQSLLQA